MYSSLFCLRVYNSAEFNLTRNTYYSLCTASWNQANIHPTKYPTIKVTSTSSISVTRFIPVTVHAGLSPWSLNIQSKNDCICAGRVHITKAQIKCTAPRKQPTASPTLFLFICTSLVPKGYLIYNLS